MIEDFGFLMVKQLFVPKAVEALGPILRKLLKDENDMINYGIDVKNCNHNSKLPKELECVGNVCKNANFLVDVPNQISIRRWSPSIDIPITRKYNYNTNFGILVIGSNCTIEFTNKQTNTSVPIDMKIGDFLSVGKEKLIHLSYRITNSSDKLIVVMFNHIDTEHCDRLRRQVPKLTYPWGTFPIQYILFQCDMSGTKNELINYTTAIHNHKNQLRIVKQLGSPGKEGTVYLLEQDKRQFALKVFRHTKKIGPLLKEVYFQLAANSSLKDQPPKRFEMDNCSTHLAPHIYGIMVNKGHLPKPKGPKVLMEAMELDLIGYLKHTNGKFTETEQYQLVKLALCLDSVGVYQNDPNPANFMKKGEHFYVIDFGFSKWISNNLLFPNLIAYQQTLFGGMQGLVSTKRLTDKKSYEIIAYYANLAESDPDQVMKDIPLIISKSGKKNTSNSKPCIIS